MTDEILHLNALLLHWYNKYKRDLPWRETQDPYIIWISEVILQQTRVVQGRSYFDRFVQRFPNVSSLARASEDEVLVLWQGLGYYSRARNLHAAAKSIMDNHGGIFPNNHKDILSLKGVGDYTAAAISSFAFDLPYATVDGNVYRVLSRIFGIDTPIDTTKGKKEFAELAQNLLNKQQPALHNQALMELGALQCVPASPDCAICPMSMLCISYASNKVAEYPVKEGKTKVRNRYFNYLNIRCNGHILLSKRLSGDIWQGLYEFPLMESNQALSVEDLMKSEEFQALFKDMKVAGIKHRLTSKHVLSHQIIHANFYDVEVETLDKVLSYLKVAEKDQGDYPISRLMERYWEQ